MLKEYAWQTFVGVENFFEEKFITTRATSTVLLHTWKTAFSEKSLKGAASVDVLALQMAMTLSGVYPPADKTKNECVTSGIFGPCTHRGLASFQKKYGIKGEADVVGTKTRAKLNRFYGSLSVKK